MHTPPPIPPEGSCDSVEAYSLGAVCALVQDMLALKYDVQLDETDFMGKAQVRTGLHDHLEPSALSSELDALSIALNAEPLHVRDAFHERLYELKLQMRRVSTFDELQRCVRRYPGTACAIAAVSDCGKGKLVAVYREAYGDQQLLVGKTRVKSGRAGPFHSFGEDNFRGAFLVDPIVTRVMRSFDSDLPVPNICPEYEHEQRSRKGSKLASAGDSSAAKVAVKACGALEGLAPPPSADAGFQVEAASAVSLIVEFMMTYPDDSSVQAAACRALRGLILPSAKTLQPTKARDCVELVAAAMRRHQLSEEVQNSACIALASIAGALPDMQSVVATNGGVEQVIAAMAQFPEIAQLQYAACAAVASLAANHPMNQTAIAASRGLEAIAMAMQDHENDCALQQVACGALGNLAANHPNNQSAIASCDGFQRIKAAMLRHSCSVEVQQSAIGALWCLAKIHPENQAIATSLGVTDLIASAVHRFGSQAEGKALKPLAAGALQVLVPGFSSYLSAASSVYTARGLGVDLPSSRSVTSTARSSTFRWPRPPSTARSRNA